MSSREPSQEGMPLSNNTYDLLTQLKAENQSLWHIKNNYKRDAANDQEALEFWNYLEKTSRTTLKS